MIKKKPLLEIKNLSVSFHTATPEGKKSTIAAVKKISFSINKGEMMALVGESGSGKSVSALSILKLLPYPAAFHPTGEIFFEGVDMLKLKGIALEAIRGDRISMIFQEPMMSLNPLHTIGKQIKEVITLHKKVNNKAVKKRIDELLGLVGLDILKNRLDAFPHELSGGQRQRIMIAIALANDPDILIADEPTTALDVTVQAQILKLLKDLQKKLNMAVLLITHDLTIVENMADTVAVMQNGELVEQGTVKQVFSKPKHKYTKHLLSSAPSGNPVKVSGKDGEIISAKKMKVHFPVKGGAFGLVRSYVKAVDNINIMVKKGHTLGVVGESGSGKTTFAMGLLRLVGAKGVVKFEGQDINKLDIKEMRGLRKRMQVVFQDPFASLNPRMTVREAIAEGLVAHDIEPDGKKRNKLIDKVLNEVGMDPKMASRYPHEFSGGQRQRICIARTLVLKPSFIVLDEPTSALDLSTQAEIIDLLKKLQRDYNLTYLFITHDLRVIKAISHDVVVMKNGKIVEKGKREQIFNKPKTAYTKALIDAAFNLKTG
jgi:microcin C transport system ATP-binding protein